MSDGFAGPVRDEHVNLAKLTELKGARVVVRVKISFRAILKISHIVNGHYIAVYFSPRGVLNLGSPVSIVGWLNA